MKKPCINIKLSYVISSHLISTQLNSSHLISSHLISSYLILFCNGRRMGTPYFLLKNRTLFPYESIYFDRSDASILVYVYCSIGWLSAGNPSLVVIVSHLTDGVIPTCSVELLNYISRRSVFKSLVPCLTVESRRHSREFLSPPWWGRRKRTVRVKYLAKVSCHNTMSSARALNRTLNGPVPHHSTYSSPTPSPHTTFFANLPPPPPLPLYKPTTQAKTLLSKTTSVIINLVMWAALFVPLLKTARTRQE